MIMWYRYRCSWCRCYWLAIEMKWIGTFYLQLGDALACCNTLAMETTAWAGNDAPSVCSLFQYLHITCFIWCICRHSNHAILFDTRMDRDYTGVHSQRATHQEEWRQYQYIGLCRSGVYTTPTTFLIKLLARTARFIGHQPSRSALMFYIILFEGWHQHISTRWALCFSLSWLMVLCFFFIRLMMCREDVWRKDCHDDMVSTWCNTNPTNLLCFSFIYF